MRKMIDRSKLSKSRSVYLERLSSFLQDGYKIQANVVAADMSFMHVKLVHHNGNRVSILAHPYDNSIEVRKNHKLVYANTLY